MGTCSRDQFVRLAVHAAARLTPALNTADPEASPFGYPSSQASSQYAEALSLALRPLRNELLLRHAWRTVDTRPTITHSINAQHHRNTPVMHELLLSITQPPIPMLSLLSTFPSAARTAALSKDRATINTS